MFFFEFYLNFHRKATIGNANEHKIGIGGHEWATISAKDLTENNNLDPSDEDKSEEVFLKAFFFLLISNLYFLFVIFIWFTVYLVPIMLSFEIYYLFRPPLNCD